MKLASSAKLVVLSGFSGAGKTTLTEKLQTTGTFAVLRSDDYHHTYQPGADVTGLLLALAESFGAAGISVIVDAVNKHPHDQARWRELGMQFAAFDWIDLDVPISECIRRDAQRSDPVGEAAIRSQIWSGLAASQEPA